MPLNITLTSVENYLDDSGGAFIKALCLGEPSAGKTRSASFWPKPIFAATENGLMSIADRRVPAARITSTAELESLVQLVRADASKPVEERQYGTFVLDTVDSWQQKIVIPEILREQRHDSMQLADWGLVSQRMNRVLTSILNLPMHVVVLCHARQVSDGDGPRVWEPRLQGSVRDTLTDDFDLVGHMATFYEAVDGERVMRRAIKWHPDPHFPILKDRSGQLPPFTGVSFSEDDFLTLRQLMFGGDYFDELPAAEQVATLEDPEPEVAPEGPKAGGPVTVKTPAPATKAAAKKAAAPEPKATPTATKRNIPAAKKAAAPVQEATPAVTETAPLPDINDQTQIGQVVPTPEAEPTEQAEPSTPEVEPTEEEAVATVTETLGATPVDEPAPAAPASEVKSPALVGTLCGTPARGISPENAAPGCGKDLGGEEMDYVNIAVMKFKTNLCFDCFTKARKAKAA